MAEQEQDLYEQLSNETLRALLQKEEYAYLKEDISPYRESSDKENKLGKVRAKIHNDKVSSIVHSLYEAYEKEEDNFDFSFCDFLGDVDFSKIEFNRAVDFGNTSFIGEAYFNEASFSGVANFRKVSFIGEAYFNEASFSGEANFYGASFIGKADFKKVKFKETVNCKNVEFKEKVVFYKTSFSGVADFYGVSFSKIVDFNGARFIGVAYFNGARFIGVAYFNGTSFSRDVNFFGVYFKEKTVFYKTSFSGSANFNEAIFSVYANFENIEFKDADFNGASFSGVAYFNGASFSGAADFNSASFIGATYFCSAIFSKETVFQEAIFSKAADFKNVEFKEIVDFKNTEFKEIVDFKNARFIGVANFKNASFENTANFEKIVDFRDATSIFERDKKVNYKYAIFCDRVYFDISEEENKEEKSKYLRADFSFCRFEESAYFYNRELSINLYGVTAEKSLFFLGARIEVENRETARVIKHEFYKQNNTLEAHQYQVKEKKLYRKELKDNNGNCIDRFNLWVQSVSTNYGQNWLKGLGWICLINIFAIDILFSFFIQKVDIKLDIFLKLFVTLILPLRTIEDMNIGLDNGIVNFIELIVDAVNISLIYLVVSAFRRFSRSK